MTRLDFIAGSVSLLGTSALPDFSCLRSDSARYGVALLGDTHFDVAPESVYHSHYDESNRHAKIQHEEFRRNGEMWASRCKDLLAASAKLATENPTDFILQMGDLIQGDCDDVPTHKQMMDDCIRYMRGAYPGNMPFLTVLGNHDIRGKGARQAYLEFAEPYMTRELKLEKSAAYPAFAWRKGPDLWIFCDFEMRDLTPIIEILNRADQSDQDRPRHTFLVTHGTFTTPEGSFPAWRLGGSPSCDATRGELYRLLSKCHAIVLSGHTHQTMFARYENEHGGFTEFTANSVWATPELGTDSPISEGADKFGAFALSRLTGKRLDEFKRTADLFRSGLTEYYLSAGAGHYRVNVQDKGVTLEFYPGASTTPARTFRLK